MPEWIKRTGGRLSRTPSRPISHKLTDLKYWGHGYSAVYKHLLVTVTEALCQDDRWWMHVSVSRKDKTMPTYADLSTIKSLVIGDERIAIQVFPPAKRHIDVAGNLDNPTHV